jgi:hypothetical protein
VSASGSSSAGLSVGPVLYDQLNVQATVNPVDVASQDFEPSLDGADSEAADDFVVPAGRTWSIDGIDADGEYFSRDAVDPVPSGFHVRFWSNGTATGLPSALADARVNQAYTSLGDSLGDVEVALDPPVVLPAGTWWVSVQARLDYGPGTHQWFWHNRALQWNQGAAWQNPGGLVGLGCTTFTRRSTCQGTTGAPDQAFRLRGTASSAAGPPPPPPPPPPPAPPPRCRVPNVIGKRLRRATPLILRSHCRVGRIARRKSARKRRGKVVAQSPRAGRRLPLNSRVKLVVGR